MKDNDAKDDSIDNGMASVIRAMKLWRLYGDGPKDLGWCAMRERTEELLLGSDEKDCCSEEMINGNEKV